jgi:hypothetical protein
MCRRRYLYYIAASNMIMMQVNREYVLSMVGAEVEEAVFKT